jgi:predicted alpha/beta-fold hydrolase
VDKALKSISIREFDTYFTTHILGYKSVDEYYADASCLPYIKDIKIPMLAINAADDPFIDPSVYKSPDLKNENVIIALTKVGGHLGFLSGFFPKRTRVLWIDKAVRDYVASEPWKISTN